MSRKIIFIQDGKDIPLGYAVYTDTSTFVSKPVKRFSGFNHRYSTRTYGQNPFTVQEHSPNVTVEDVLLVYNRLYNDQLHYTTLDDLRDFLLLKKTRICVKLLN